MGIGFPDGFRWGTATSAYQVEGDNTASDWWLWEQQPGRIRGGDRSGLACDWWRSAERDFDLMVALHQNAARLSVEWSRLEPRPGQWDQAAEERYLEMFRGLRARGIEPLVTLNHFTLPRWVAERGGWTWKGIVPALAAFAGRFVRAAAVLVDFWITINEPVGHLIGAYLLGQLAPGRTSLAAFIRALVHSVRAHAAAYRAVHQAQPEARVGVAAYLRPVQPVRADSPLDRWLAARMDRLVNWMYLDALRTGWLVGPAGIRVRIPEAVGTLDFLGVNYYTRTLLAFDLRRPRTLFARPETPFDSEMSDADYSEVYPDGLLLALRQARRYGLPMYVTENGLPDADDDLRPRFIVDHLRRIGQAVQEGCPVLGYYHWSLVDNFEWAEGWNLRFGLYALDPATQVRTARPSAALYAEICRQNGLP
ncbi:MAG: glycoside hydrolase family 1 protein [Armatimonadetes bacterium]|nr:glycoside hydrolase family 1 protein [Armatimonadota bacterium]